MSGSQEEARAVADGRLSDGSRSSQTSPRTPEGPSETRMRRKPIFTIGHVVQKSRPVSSCTFSSRVSAASFSVSWGSEGAAVLSVMGPISVGAGTPQRPRGAGGRSGGGRSRDGAGLLGVLPLDLHQAATLGAALLLQHGVGDGRGEEQPLGV